MGATAHSSPTARYEHLDKERPCLVVNGFPSRISVMISVRVHCRTTAIDPMASPRSVACTPETLLDQPKPAACPLCEEDIR